MASGKMYTSEVFMRKRYLMDRKSPEEIAKECGCSVETVYVYLAKFGLRKSKRWLQQLSTPLLIFAII